MFALLLSDAMDPFYRNISSFPTAIFTFVLALCVLFWLVAILGWVEIDALDFDFDAGGVDASVDTSTGDGFSTHDVLGGLLIKFGFEDVPITVIISLISLVGWLVCYYAVLYLLNPFPGDFVRYLGGIPVFIGSLYVATMITSWLIRPLRPLFRKASQHVEKQVLGQVAVVRTSRVDNKFGEVKLDDGGAGLILKARANGEEVFATGDRVVLLEYLREENVYRVIAEKEFTG